MFKNIKKMQVMLIDLSCAKIVDEDRTEFDDTFIQSNNLY